MDSMLLHLQTEKEDGYLPGYLPGCVLGTALPVTHPRSFLLFFFFFSDVLPVTKPRRDVRGSCSQTIISLILLRSGKVSMLCYGCLLLSIYEDVLMAFH